MIKKIIAIIIYFILAISISQTITLGSYLFGEKNEGVKISKDIILSFMPYIYRYMFNSKIYYDGIYKGSNKVDIVISNHINSLDFNIYLSLIKEFDSKPFYFIFFKHIVFVPSIGFILGSGKDVKMNRKIEYDIDNINEFISNIEEGIIILMPEGYKFTPEKRIISQKYSRDNNLPIFNNVLFPKMKGLFTIANILKKNNKLGNIIDMTIQADNLKKIDAPLEKLITTELGDSFSVINTYNIPEKHLDNYDNFKKWFLFNIWQKKDIILDNIHTNYNYKELKPNIKNYELFILIICLTLFGYLLVHTKGIYLPVSLIISYALMYSLYRKISIDDKKNNS
jgi:1-acyl-sn-glycerol-3-phosphate acyltransferase